MRRFFFAAVLACSITLGAWAQGKQAGAAGGGSKSSQAGATAGGGKTSQAGTAGASSQAAGSKSSQAAGTAIGGQVTGSKSSQAAAPAARTQQRPQTRVVNNAGQRGMLEMFDGGGIPANPATGVERDLMQRIMGHQSGDLDEAARIQRDLAGYYRSRGDYTRARAAEERAAGYYGGMPMMVAPRRQQEEGPPAFGNVPAPVDAKDEGAIDVPVYQPATPAKTGDAALPLPAADAPPAAVPPAAAATPAQPAGAPPLAGRFHVLQGRTLHMWDFRPDGTFEHGWSDANGTGPAGMENGTYSVNGPYMTLFVARRAGTAGRTQRRMRFETRGADGILLDGRALRPALP